ncbi:MAG: DegV family protein, partial [Dehalococcoidales bacterium]
MSVKIVTDSTSDLPKEVAAELGIAVIPLNVHFDLDTFSDGVDIQPEEFYHRLLTSRYKYRYLQWSLYVQQCCRWRRWARYCCPIQREY